MERNEEELAVVMKVPWRWRGKVVRGAALPDGKEMMLLGALGRSNMEVWSAVSRSRWSRLGSLLFFPVLLSPLSPFLFFLFCSGRPALEEPSPLWIHILFFLNLLAVGSSLVFFHTIPSTLLQPFDLLGCILGTGTWFDQF